MSVSRLPTAGWSEWDWKHSNWGDKSMRLPTAGWSERDWKHSSWSNAPFRLPVPSGL